MASRNLQSEHGEANGYMSPEEPSSHCFVQEKIVNNLTSFMSSSDDTALQVTGNLSQSKKSASESPTSTTNHVTNFGQRSMGRDETSSGAYSSPNKGDYEQSTEHQEAKVESLPNSGKSATVLNSDDTQKESPKAAFGSQLKSVTAPYYQQNLYRRGNDGLYQRGDGKPDQGRGQGWARGNQQWIQHSNFNRGANMQPQRGGYILPSVNNSAPFIPQPMPLQVQPFGNNVMYPGFAFYYPGPVPLHVKIMKQIHYYFSNENLVKDTYLRQNMDSQGWVLVHLIAGFNKVSILTNSTQLILDVMRKSTLVEVQGNKMRRRNDWMKWLLPLGTQLDNGFSSRPSSGEMRSQLQQGGGDRALMA